MSEDILNEVKEELSNSKKIKVAINGFGRIGRMIFRAGFDDPSIEFIAEGNSKTINIIDLPIRNPRKQGIIKQISEAKELAKSMKEKNTTHIVILKIFLWKSQEHN